MIVESVSVKGKDKETAEVSFTAGLNVIAGASDTGKSYILKCLDYLLGSDAPPKSIKESEGYTHVEAVIHDDDGSKLRLSREIGESKKVTVTSLDDDEITLVLNPDHRGSESLSNFFMEKLDLDNKILVQGVKSLKHASFTLRLLKRVFIVDEGRIISESSPLGAGQNTEKTLEQSMLKTLLTGEDDAAVLEMKQRKKTDSSLSQEVQSLTDFMNRFMGDDEKESIDNLDKELESLQEQSEIIEARLDQLVSGNEEMMDTRQSYVEEIGLLSEKINDQRALNERFLQLKEKYRSDQERLVANSEATIYLEQQILANCPTCGQSIEDSDDLKIELVLDSNRAELEKISRQIGDLDETTSGIAESLESNENRMGIMESRVSEIDRRLEESVGNAILDDRKNLKAISDKRAELRSKIDHGNRRKSVAEEIGKLQAELGEEIDRYEISDFGKESSAFAKSISDVLQRWGFPNSSEVAFDLKDRDIVIGGKKRALYGKGYRAVTFTAFLIGLLEVLKGTNRHPGFLLFDSPLTTYKKQDEQSDSEEIILTNDLIYAFYRDLADSYKESQIIILENQEPDEDLQSFINYVHFSGNKSIGRYGFFPNF